MTQIPYDYILFEQLQKKKEEYYMKNGCGLGFFQTVQLFKQNGEYLNGIPERPDFLSWNRINYSDLKERIDRIPIPLDDVLCVKESVLNNVRHLSTHNPVQISMESCYNDNLLMSVGYFCVFYVLQGSCRLRIKQTEKEMTEGDLCILPPHVPYCIHTTPEDMVLSILSAEDHFKYNFNQLLYRDNIVSAFFRRALFDEEEKPISFVMHPDTDIRSLIQHLFAEFVTGDSYSETLFNNYLQIFYASIIRSSERYREDPDLVKPNSVRDRMPAILNYITNQYHTLTLQTLAYHFNYEPAYLSKMIKMTTGKNFSKIVTELKIDEAKELLVKTNKSIDEVAELTGYGGADHFGYTFKRVTGLSPRQYRATK